MSSNNNDTVNLSNWRSRPHNIYAFSNTKHLIPAHTIETGQNETMQLDSLPISLDSLEIKSSDGSVFSMEDFLRETSTDGFVILKEGKIIYEFYDNANTVETPHIIMSATKSVVGLVLGILCDNGVVKIDSPASDYVPEISNTCYKGVTVRQLIDMQAGVKLNDWNHKYRAAMGWEPKNEDDGDVSSLYDYLGKVSAPSEPHGERFNYLSHNTDLVGWVIERAVGKTLSEIIEELLWKPIGAASEAYMTVDSQGNPRGAGGLCVTVRDLARLGQVVANDGRRGDTQIIPRSWIEDMQKNGSHEAFAKGNWAQGYSKLYRRTSYRSAWIAVEEPSLIMAMGIHGQHLFVDREHQIVMAKTSSQDQMVNPETLKLTHKAARAILHYLINSQQG